MIFHYIYIYIFGYYILYSNNHVYILYRLTRDLLYSIGVIGVIITLKPNLDQSLLPIVIGGLGSPSMNPCLATCRRTVLWLWPAMKALVSICNFNITIYHQTNGSDCSWQKKSHQLQGFHGADIPTKQLGIWGVVFRCPAHGPYLATSGLWSIAVTPVNHMECPRALWDDTFVCVHIWLRFARKFVSWSSFDPLQNLHPSLLGTLLGIGMGIEANMKCNDAKACQFPIASRGSKNFKMGLNMLELQHCQCPPPQRPEFERSWHHPAHTHTPATEQITSVSLWFFLSGADLENHSVVFATFSLIVDDAFVIRHNGCCRLPVKSWWSCDCFRLQLSLM